MKGQCADGSPFLYAILRCPDFPQSAFRLWLERPGQDLNLRGVTQRFSRPPPYRTRRPGQRVILRQMSRIIVPTYAVAGEHLNPEASSTERCTSPRKSTPAGGRLLSNSVPRR